MTRTDAAELNTYFANHEEQLRIKGWGLIRRMRDEFVAANPNSDMSFEQFKKAASKYRKAHNIAAERAHGTYYERRITGALQPRLNRELQICESELWVHEVHKRPAVTLSDSDVWTYYIRP
jgi:hypothetical protein